MNKIYRILILALYFTNSFGQEGDDQKRTRMEIDSVMRLKDFDKIARKLIQDSSGFEIIFIRTIGLAEKKRGLEALTMLDNLLSVKPNDRRLLIMKSMAIYSLDDNEHVNYYLKQVKKNPKDPSNHFSLAQGYSRLKTFNKALVQYDKAVELDPTEEYYRYERAKCKYNLDRKKEACNEMQSLKLYEAKRFRGEKCE